MTKNTSSGASYMKHIKMSSRTPSENMIHLLDRVNDALWDAGLYAHDEGFTPECLAITDVAKSIQALLEKCPEDCCP